MSTLGKLEDSIQKLKDEGFSRDTPLYVSADGEGNRFSVFANIYEELALSDANKLDFADIVADEDKGEYDESELHTILTIFPA